MMDIAILTAGVLLSLYAYRVDFERYAIHTTGVFKRVDRRVVKTDHECHEDYCAAEVSPGEARRWFKEIVVMGVPLVRYGGGTHYYCADHVAFELHNTELVPEKSRPERLKLTLVEAVGELLRPVEQPTSEESDIERVETSMNDAFGLAGVALLILVTAMIFMAVRALAPGE